MYKKLVIAAVFLLKNISSLYALADISFVIIDLKYNQGQGVKICEMQPGSFSRFSGADALFEMNAVSNMYVKILADYNVPLYFTHPLPPKMKEALIKRGGSSVHVVEKLMTKLEDKPLKDPDNLFEFYCFLFSLSTADINRGYPHLSPQILFLDRAILPYSENKYLMNRLFDCSAETKKVRPHWNVYQKAVSEKLVNTIIKEIPGDLLVIKPLESTMGRGVIILEKKDLLSTLDYIFNTDKEVLLQDMERSYSHYGVDTSDYFIVEEFIESDPILLGSKRQPYDCTMRVMAVLSYHQKVPNVTFLEEYWYSPRKPIDKAYNLIESHKAKGTFFHEVSKEVKQEVEAQLHPALLAVYEKMLETENRSHLR
jgi:hypothetical protein